jgi:ammonium transporter, Amt family
MNLIPGLTLRAAEEAEIEGIDEAEIGEFAYDFVEKERDYLHDIHDEIDEGIEGRSPPSSEHLPEPKKADQ